MSLSCLNDGESSTQTQLSAVYVENKKPYASCLMMFLCLAGSTVIYIYLFIYNFNQNIGHYFCVYVWRVWSGPCFVHSMCDLIASVNTVKSENMSVIQSSYIGFPSWTCAEVLNAESYLHNL